MLCSVCYALRTVEVNSGSIAAERAALEDYKDPSEKLTHGLGEKKA